MKNGNETAKKNNGAVKSGLYLSLPFLLCLIAVFLLSYWGYNAFIKNNSKVRLSISPYSTNDNDIFLSKNTAVKVEPDPEWTDDVLETEEEDFVVPSVMPHLKYGQRFGTFSLPRFDYYNRGLYNCDNPDVFGYYVGRALYAWLPGQGKNIVLCAHCTNSFIYLEMLEPGDIIQIKTIYGIYEYEVVFKKVFEPYDTTYVLKSYDEEMLTCYTCYPYRTTQPRKMRIAVVSKKIKGPDFAFNPNTCEWELVSGGTND